MKNNLTCSQVIALLSYYIGGETNYQVTNFVQSHLCKCKSCYAKYEALAKVFSNFNEMKMQIDEIKPQNVMPISSYSDSFKETMSAYLDSELSDDEIIRFKKYAIANQPVRKELEGLYKIKNALNNSFERTKNDLKGDFSKDIIIKLDMQDAIQMQEPILKIASIFIFLMVFCSVGLIVLLM